MRGQVEDGFSSLVREASVAQSVLAKSHQSNCSGETARLEEGGELGGVGCPLHGVEQAEDFEALIWAATGNLHHPILGGGGGDDDLVGPGDDLRCVHRALSDALDKKFGLGSIVHVPALLGGEARCQERKRVWVGVSGWFLPVRLA